MADLQMSMRTCVCDESRRMKKSGCFYSLDGLIKVYTQLPLEKEFLRGQ
jgi:hypothetical protein